MSKFWKISGAISLLLLILGLGFAFFIAPGLLESKEELALKKLKKKGVVLSYQQLDYTFGGVEISELHLETLKKGFKVECDFERIEVEMKLLSLLSELPQVDLLRVVKGNCKVEKKKTQKKDEEKKTPQKPKNLFAKLNLPKIIIEDSILRFTQHSLRLQSLLIDPSGPVEGAALIRALGEKYEVKINGKVGPDDLLSLQLSPKNKDFFDLNILGNALQLGSADISLHPAQKKISLEFNQLDIHRKGVVFKTRLATVKNTSHGSMQFQLKGVNIDLDTQPLRALLSARKTSKTDLSSAPLVSPLALLDKLELDFSDLSLSVTHGDRRIQLVEQAKGRWNKGHLSFDGSVAKGHLRARALVNPKAKEVYQLEAELNDVHLGELPGMPTGRSLLPNRGTSGKLDGLLSGSFRLKSPLQLGIDRHLHYAMSLTWTDGILDLEGVSEMPLDNIELALALTGKLNTSTFRVENTGFIYAGPLILSTQIVLSGWSKDPTIQFKLKGGKKPCRDYFKAFPKSLWGALSQAKVSGQSDLKLNIEYFHARPQETILNIKGYKNCGVDNLASTQKLEFEILGETKPSQRERDVTWLRKKFRKKVKEVDEGKTVFVGPGTKSYVSIDTLPEHVGGAAYLSEQVNFYKGKAVNFALIQRALRRNLDEGRFVYGGSTITQQLVKNLFLSRNKTLSRKLQEMLIAWRIDGALSKDRILELYLNCIEFGPNLYGIGPAAKHYFQKSATQLTPKESVFLAMLKPAPWRGLWYVNRGSTPTNPYFLERTDILLDRLLEKEIITEETLELEKRVHLTWNQGVYSRIVDPKPDVETAPESIPKMPEP